MASRPSACSDVHSGSEDNRRDITGSDSRSTEAALGMGRWSNCVCVEEGERLHCPVIAPQNIHQLTTTGRLGIPSQLPMFKDIESQTVLTCKCDYANTHTPGVE